MAIINILHHGETIALQFFDYYHAFMQNQNQLTDYQAKHEIVFNQPLTSDKINILLVDFEKCFHYRNNQDYDVVLIDNRAEPLEVSSYMVLATLDQNSKAYLLCGSLLHDLHPYANKMVSYNTDLYLLLDCVTRPFYPQHFGIKSDIKENRRAVCFINGQNRTWRQFFLQCLHDTCGDTIPVRNKIHTYRNHATKLQDCAFESEQDTIFRTWLNANIKNTDIADQEKIKYYENSVSVGIASKFGKVAPGYFILPEYLQYHCIIYPEASWINNQLFLTEKTFKCFATKSIPWPISGANCHRMLQDLGFKSAIELLPAAYQTFDSIEDHRARYVEQCKAIRYAIDHPEIWISTQAQEIRQTNFERFYQCSMNFASLEKFDRLLDNCLSSK